YRRSEHSDVHPGALDLQAIQAPDQDREPQQQVHGHGAPVAAVFSRQPLLRVVHGRAARLRQARRELRPCRHQGGGARRRRVGPERSIQAQERPGVPRFHHRPDRERLSDGPGRQGPHRDDSCRGVVSPTHNRVRSTLAEGSLVRRRHERRVTRGAERSEGWAFSEGTMRHIISIMLENEPGALSRVAGLFSARGYNIETLTVAPTEEPSLSRMTIVTSGSDDVIEQITKQLNKLIEVVKVVDLSEAAHIERELMLIKVRATGKDREEMKRLSDIFLFRITAVTESTYT